MVDEVACLVNVIILTLRGIAQANNNDNNFKRKTSPFPHNKQDDKGIITVIIKKSIRPSPKRIFSLVPHIKSQL